MKYMFAVLMAALMVVVMPVSASDLDNHIQREYQYWMNGVPNQHQRYAVYCGAIRASDAAKIPQTSDTAVVMTTVSNDLDYIYMLAATKACAMIPNLIIEATAQILGDQADAQPSKAFINRLMPVAP